jgi:hypothetical protein
VGDDTTFLISLGQFDETLLNEGIGRYLCKLAHRLGPLPFEFGVQHPITPNASN